MLWIPVFRTLLHLVFYCFSFPVFYNYIHFCFLCFRFRFLSSRQALKVYERRSPKGWLGHFLVPSSGLPVLLKPTYTDPGLSVQPRRTSNWRPLLSLWSRGLLRASLHSLPLAGGGGGGGMKDVVGSPGTWSGMALRLSQCVSAGASMGAMATAYGFSNYTAFW
jgi:hypothetical protein